MRSFAFSDLCRLFSCGDSCNPLRLKHILNVDINRDSLIGWLRRFHSFLEILRRVISFSDGIFFYVRRLFFRDSVFQVPKIDKLGIVGFTVLILRLDGDFGMWPLCRMRNFLLILFLWDISLPTIFSNDSGRIIFIRDESWIFPHVFFLRIHLKFEYFNN